MTTRRSGFTLVELMFVTAITAVIVGALAGLFVFVGARASQAMASNGVLLQSQSLANELDAAISQSNGCQAITLGSLNAIRCTQPADGVDRDGDGIADSFLTDNVGPLGREAYGSGRRVWFYMSDSTGDPSRNPTGSMDGYLYRAYRNDDNAPTVADIDRKFSFYYDTGGYKWNLVNGVQFSTNADGTVNYRIVSSKLRQAERRINEATDSLQQGKAFVLSRTVFCQYWRK